MWMQTTPMRIWPIPRVERSDSVLCEKSDYVTLLEELSLPCLLEKESRLHGNSWGRGETDTLVDRADGALFVEQFVVDLQEDNLGIGNNKDKQSCSGNTSCWVASLEQTDTSAGLKIRGEQAT